MSDILLVGDNLHNVSWGARGATLSLMEVLEQQHRIFKTIGGDHYHLGSAGYGLISSLTPARYSRLLLHAYKNQDRRRIFQLYFRLERLFGAKDFVDLEPEHTAANILHYRKNYPELGELYATVEKADAVFVNGEGDMVFTTPPRREVLFMLGILALAQRMGKASFLVNAMLSDCPVDGRNEETAGHAGRILEHCAAVAVRDPESLRIGKQIAPNARFFEVPDSLFSWQSHIESLSRLLPSSGDFFIPWQEDRQLFGKLDFGSDFICLGGGAGIGNDENAAIESYCDLVRELRALGLPVYLILSDGRDAFLRKVALAENVAFIPAATPIIAASCILARARVVVSGRYHPTILASLGGTPSIYLGSSAHKMTSLQALLSPPVRETFSSLPASHEISRIASVVAEYIRSGEEVRTRTLDAARQCADRARQLPFLLAESSQT